MPMPRRIPKRGFKNPNRVEAFPINVATLEKMFDAGATVDLDALRAKGLVPKLVEHVKILGEGELTRSSRSRRSASRRPRRQKIEAAGGSVDDHRRPTARARRLRYLPLAWLDRKYHEGSRAPPADPVHAGDARGLSRRRVHHDPGRQPRRDEPRRDEGRLRLVPRHVQHVLGRRAAAAVDLRARHHAVRDVVDRDAAAHGRRAQARPAQQRRRAGPAQDQPAHPLRHDPRRASCRRGSSRRYVESLSKGGAEVVAAPGPRASASSPCSR